MYENIQSLKDYYSHEKFLVTQWLSLGPLVFVHYSNPDNGFRLFLDAQYTEEISGKTIIKLYKLGIIQQFTIGY